MKVSIWMASIVQFLVAGILIAHGVLRKSLSPDEAIAAGLTVFFYAAWASMNALKNLRKELES